MDNDYFSAWLPRYLHYLRMRNYSPRTIKTYEGVIRLFASYVWARHHSDPSKLVIYEKDLKRARFDTTVHITALVISDYLTFISSQYTYRPKTLHRVISTLSSFYRFLVSQGVMESNPAAGVERPRIKHQELIYMKHSQVLALIASIGDPRDHLIVRTIYATGVRVSELCGINVEDIDFDEHIIRIRGKGGKIRIVFVDEDTLGEIRTFLDGRTTGPLFIGQNGKNLSPRTVQNLFRQYAPKGITPHKIRHSYASELYRRSKNLRVVQENLGHSSIMTTEVYLHTDVDERKRVYNRYFPLSSKDDEKKEGEEKSV